MSIGDGGFVPYDYRKDTFRRWVDKVDKELLMLHVDMQKLAVLVNSKVSSSGAGQPVTGESSPTDTSSDFTDITTRSFSSGLDLPLGDLTDIEKQTKQMGSSTGDTKEDQKSLTDSLVGSTYAIRAATVSMRGYLMLVEQMGLSKDQKKMVSEIETVLMSVMKLVQAVGVIRGAMETGLGDPMGLVKLFIGGGYLSGGLAYGNKVVGGVI